MTEAIKEKKQPNVRKRVIIAISVVVVVLIAAAAIVLALLVNAKIYPPGKAAKYDTLSYIAEDDVTDYINTYRTMSGYDSDEAWAQELADEGYTPATFRLKTIRQLIVDALVAKKANELNIAVDESQVDEYIENMKDSLGMGDEELFQQTLEMYGRTEEDMRNLYIQELTRQAVFEKEVEVPTPTDEETANYISATYATGVTTKHSYCLRMEKDTDEASYEKLAEIQKVRKLLLEDGLTKKNFAAYVTMYCVDDDLKERSGANGWSLDTSSLSSAYQGILEDTKVGHLSDVFEDDGFYCFIWVDDSFSLPDLSNTDGGTLTVDEYLKDMPSTLKEYFSDCAAQTLWKADCDTYLAELYNDSNPQVCPMPSGLSYDVDMTGVTASDDSSSDSTDSDGSDESTTDSSTSSDSSNTESKGN